MLPCSATAGKDLSTLLRVGAIGQMSDAELLERFAAGRGDAASEAAFEVLVARHGPMVLGVCRRVLGDPHAADDAFQATFLVLVRKAPRIRVDDSLGRWLYGVTLRVARRARAVARRERARSREMPAFDPPAPDLGRRDDLRATIDAEIARLPARYRSAVVLCDLEGLSQEQAARQLRCPIGTVHSRLHRARERLRSGLSRRGLAPPAMLAPRAEIPPSLVATTVVAASRLAYCGRLAGIVPAAVALLTRPTWKEWIMIPGWCSGVIWVAFGLVTTGAIAPGDGPDQETKTPAEAPKSDAEAAPVGPSIADRFARIRAEYDAQQDALRRAQGDAKTPREQNEIYARMAPDDVAFCRRMVDLAASNVKDPGARDALVWVLNFPGRSDERTYGDEFARAAALLVRHHGDDPEAVRVGLQLDRQFSRHRDAILTGFLAAAKAREAKGLARMAMAQYLEIKAKAAAGARKAQGRQKIKYVGVVGDDGKVFDLEQDQSDEAYAYQLELRQCDPEFLRAEAERLLEEVIAEYGDVPHITIGHRKLEALLKQPTPTWNGKPMTDDKKRQLEARLARARTLGQVAEARLDAMRNLAVGKTAPEIDGVDFDGKPLKLSDYRGKVVVLVFWGSWCGPCVREIPRERELVERHKDQPFALLGVACDEKKEDAVKVMERERVTWPNWLDGAPGSGPIANRYHIRGYPTCLVLDANGVIRHTKIQGDGLDKAVADLLAEQAAKAAR